MGVRVVGARDDIVRIGLDVHVDDAANVLTGLRIIAQKTLDDDKVTRRERDAALLMRTARVEEREP